MFNKKAGVTDMIKKVDSDHFFSYIRGVLHRDSETIKLTGGLLWLLNIYARFAKDILR